jgi:hypothetical protein
MLLDDFFRDYGGKAFPLPEIAGKYADKNKVLIIAGDAACVWEDIERAGGMSRAGLGSVGGPFDYLTVNKLVEVFPGNIEHAYSNQPHYLETWIKARRVEYVREFDGPRNTHSCNKGAKWYWPLGGHATSGLGAALVGVGLGYEKIILCGIPLTDGPHNGEPPWRKTRFTNEAADSADGMNRHWRNARDYAFRGRVKSMSGRTREWLGAP